MEITTIIMLTLYAIWLWGSKFYVFAKKPIFPTTKRTCLQLLQNVGCYWDGSTNQCLIPNYQNNPSINLLSSVLRVPKYSNFQRLKLSVTGDTANRLGFNPRQRFVHFTRKIWSLFLRSRTSECLRTRWPKHGLPKSSSEHCPVLIQSYCSSTSASTVPARVITMVNQARAHNDLRLHS